MYNRKFNIKRDFSAINELENTIKPIIDRIENKEDSALLENYVIKIFFNQFKK